MLKNYNINQDGIIYQIEKNPIEYNPDYGFLRLNSASRQPSFKISDIKVKTIPAKSQQNSINAI